MLRPSVICDWLNELEERGEVLNVVIVPIDAHPQDTADRPVNISNIQVLVRLADEEEEEEGNFDYYTIQESIANSVN